MPTSTVLSEELITKMRELVRRESETLFDQGDLLVANPLDDEQMSKLAEILGIKVSTLQLRAKVSREVPKKKRQANTPWSVYRELIRIDDPKARWELFDQRPEWTVTAIQRRVAEIKSQGRAVAAARGGCRVGTVDIKAEMGTDGVLKIVVRTPDGISEPRFLEISDNEGMLVAKIED